MSTSAGPSTSRAFSRIEMARLHLLAAIDLFERDAPWPTVLILARAAGQYLSERLRADGRTTYLADTYEDAKIALGIDVPFDVWKRRIEGKAELFKHAKDEREPDQVVIHYGDVTQALLGAIGDYIEVTGSHDAQLLAWAERHFARPEMVAFRERMRDPAEHEKARQISAAALLKLAAEPRKRRRK